MVPQLLDAKDSKKQTENSGTGTLGCMEGEGGSGLPGSEAFTACFPGRQFPSKTSGWKPVEWSWSLCYL